MKKYTILFVDDEEQNGLTFKHAFFRHYHIMTATSGKQALEMLSCTPIQLVISDQRMPEMSGIDLLKVCKEKHPEVIRMIVTGYSDVEAVMRAVNEAGIFHYALKPWNNGELKMAIDNALEKYQLKEDKEGLLQQLQLLNTHLEQKVEERTKALTARNEEYRNLNEVKDKLFSVISHDLRGPMGSLSVFIDTYLKYEGVFTPEETKNTLAGMRDSVTSLTQMLNNLLSWSQSQLKLNEANFNCVVLDSLIQEHLKVYKQMAFQKGISVKCEYTEPLPVIWGSADLISIILRNLLSNAIKFTPRGGIIAIKACLEAEKVFVSVKDTGVGISNENIQKLFERDRLYSTLGTAKEKGIGLGLRLCQEYAQKLGGSLSIDSELDKGTTFTFSLAVSTTVHA